MRSRGAHHALSLRQLAHELNSMLDGSMRCISIAQRALLDTSDDPDALAAAATRLALAHENMQAMAALLDQTLRGTTSWYEKRPIGEQVPRIIASCSDKADETNVTIDLHVDDAAANVPIGPLGPIVLNGLRNAIEACSESSESFRHVELSIGINAKHHLEMFITDTGPGVQSHQRGASTKPGGHGIGLEVCRRIAASLDGSVELMNVPFGRGAVLRVLVPLSGLNRA